MADPQAAGNPADAVLDRRGALSRMHLPGLGLMVLGFLSATLWGVMAIAPEKVIYVSEEVLPNLIPKSESDEAKDGGEEKGEIDEQVPQAPPLWATLAGVLTGVIAILGGIEARKLGNRRLAMAGAIMTLTPCFGPCCCVGLLLGPWALVPMLREDVTAHFARP